ncbi:hypothetical protein MTR67_044196 [Solanum verrucosum]|uniref:CCHC-type domain-containing protein n=1 Tax=Solanum verrucosum TaxID=315347 RepID=A0AAF0USW6_SOLVR|nr:hypothetical protein MTR67_044196 [Solanum verrucosum]
MGQPGSGSVHSFRPGQLDLHRYNGMSFLRPAWPSLSLVASETTSGISSAHWSVAPCRWQSTRLVDHANNTEDLRCEAQGGNENRYRHEGSNNDSHNRRGGRSSGGLAKQGCYECGEIGNWARDCPQHSRIASAPQAAPPSLPAPPGARFDGHGKGRHSHFYAAPARAEAEASDDVITDLEGRGGAARGDAPEPAYRSQAWGRRRPRGRDRAAAPAQEIEEDPERIADHRAPLYELRPKGGVPNKRDKPWPKAKAAPNLERLPETPRPSPRLVVMTTDRGRLRGVLVTSFGHYT